MSKPIEILEDLATTFDALAKKPIPDPSNPTPLYVSRMHFEDWAERIRKAMVLQLEQVDKIDDGRPAFPFVETDPLCGTRIHPGMTLRDWFAGQALAGLSSEVIASSFSSIASLSYKTADAMLLARKTETLDATNTDGAGQNVLSSQL
jgi:hypothetical protein